MQDDATKNAYASTYTTSGRQFVSSRPDNDVIYIGDSVSVLEVAIQDVPEEMVELKVILPNKREGKKLEILNSSAEDRENFYGYILTVYEVVDSELVTMSVPGVTKGGFKQANFAVVGNIWVAAGITVHAAIGTLWNTVKNGTILFFGFGNISEIYEAEHFEVPYDCPFVSVNYTENVESKQLQLILSQDFKAANKLITLSVNLDGTAKHTLDVFLSGDGISGLSLEDIANGLWTLRCVADATYNLVISWLPIASEVEV